MQLSLEVQQSEATLYARGIESILRKVVRFAVGHLSLVKLQEMLTFLFIEEAEEQLRTESPSRNAPKAQLALLTGLDTRSISKVRNSPHYRKSLTASSEFLRDYTATANLLERWVTDPKFVDTRRGRPKALTVFGESGSIEALAKPLKFGRGVTPTAIVERLRRSGLVRVDADSGKVEILTAQHLPAPDEDREGAVEMGFAAIGRLMGTVFANLEGSGEGERFYQRAFWTIRLSPHRRAELREKLTRLLRGFEKKGVDLLGEYDMTYGTTSQEVAGFGMYYFEGE